MKSRTIVMAFVSFFLVLLLFVLLTQEAYANPGKYCGSSSPCSCGINCTSSYEIYSNTSQQCESSPLGCFNTIDTCKDGYDNLTKYEWVENITLTDLDGSTFSPGHTVEIDGLFMSTPETETITYAYNNGSGWKNLVDFQSHENPAAYIHKYYNFTIDNVVGNHTIRAIIAWHWSHTGGTCGYDYEEEYSDTDDIMFLVQDSGAPVVEDIRPSNGASYELIEDLSITISANVSDNSGLDQVYAIVSWDSNNQTVNLSDPDSNGLFDGSFNNVTIDSYSVRIYANDSFGNMNSSITTTFTIIQSSNLTIDYPEADSEFAYTNVLFRARFEDNTTHDWFGYELNGNTNVSGDFKLKVNNSASDGDGTLFVESKDYHNLSQSFTTSYLMDVDKIELKLRRNGSGVENYTLQLKSDNSGPAAILAQGSITNSTISDSAFSWVNITLNSTIRLVNNTKYWIFLSPNGTGTDYYQWEASDDGFSGGESLQNNSLDYLFKVHDKYRYRAVMSAAQGVNSLKVYANNSLGIRYGSQIVNFTVDSLAPVVDSFWQSNLSVEVGSIVQFEIDLIDAVSSTDKVLLEINRSTNITMIYVPFSGLHVYNYTTNITGNLSIKVHYNDTYGNYNFSDTYHVLVNDSQKPSINIRGYSPNTSDQLDPSVMINVSANVTDYSSLNSVILEYIKIGSGPWSNTSMNLIGGFYYGNFTPDSAGNWSFRVRAVDGFGNINTSSNITLEIINDWSWTISPGRFDAVSSLIYGNVTVGNLTINNTGDYTISINISKHSGSPTLTFNVSQLDVNAGSVSYVEVTAFSPNTGSPATYDLRIKIQSNNLSASPNTLYSNFTYITYITGPYLYLEILAYDPDVTQGQNIDNLTLKLTNLGNESSINTSVRWVLPSEWSSRKSLNYTIGTLATNTDYTYSIPAFVGTDASTGTQIIIAEASSSNADSSSVSKSVNVNSATNDTIILIPGGGGGSSGGGVVGGGAPVPSLLVDYPEIIEILRGKAKTFLVEVTNNRASNITNLDLDILGFQSTHLEIKQDAIIELAGGKTKTFEVTLNVPYYYKEGKYPLTLSISADSGQGSTIEYNRSMTLIVLKTDKIELISCLLDAEELIENMELEGFNTDILGELLVDANKDYIDNNYEFSEETCKRIISLGEKAYYIKEEVAKIQQQIDIGRYNLDDTERALELVLNAFSRGDYELAEQRLNEALLLQTTEIKIEQARLINRIRVLLHYWWILIPSLFLVYGAGQVLYKTTSKSYLREKINDLREEEMKIIDLIKNTQEDYFNHKIMSSRVYEKHINQYKNRIAKIQRELSDLNMKMIKHLNVRQDKFLQEERRRIEELLKEIQRKYYNEKVIDKSSYDSMITTYRKILIEIDKKIELGKNGKK